jgi:hypothetical protein
VNLHPKGIRRGLRLAFPAPGVTDTILSGSQPSNLTLAKIPKRFPLSWAGMPLLVDDASQTREVISSNGSQETIFLTEEVVFREWRRWAEIITGQHRAQ